jgi:hypothetical protein
MDIRHNHLSISLAASPSIQRVAEANRKAEEASFMDARRRALQEKIDPWVVVGTTTVDGLISQVVERIGGNANDLMGWQEPRDVGGRMLVGHEFNTTQDGIVVMRCDIVRRRSEINAEKANAAADRLMAAVERYEQEHATTCPECGPHGNAGRVLLLESWVDCTSCHHPDVVDDGVLMVAPPRASFNIVAETDTAEAALSASLLAEGASAEVAQQGVRSFVDAINRAAPQASSPLAVKSARLLIDGKPVALNGFGEDEFITVGPA